MNGYPPGVTGREYAIAGPDSEADEERTCGNCGRTGLVDVATFGGQQWWDCPAPIPAHPIAPMAVSGRIGDGWGTVGYTCMTCGEPALGCAVDALLEGKVVDDHPATGGCGAHHEEDRDDGPDPDEYYDRMRDDAALDYDAEKGMARDD